MRKPLCLKTLFNSYIFLHFSCPPLLPAHPPKNREDTKTNAVDSSTATYCDRFRHLLDLARIALVFRNCDLDFFHRCPAEKKRWKAVDEMWLDHIGTLDPCFYRMSFMEFHGMFRWMQSVWSPACMLPPQSHLKYHGLMRQNAVINHIESPCMHHVPITSMILDGCHKPNSMHMESFPSWTILRPLQGDFLQHGLDLILSQFEVPTWLLVVQETMQGLMNVLRAV